MDMSDYSPRPRLYRPQERYSARLTISAAPAEIQMLLTLCNGHDAEARSKALGNILNYPDFCEAPSILSGAYILVRLVMLAPCLTTAQQRQWQARPGTADHLNMNSNVRRRSERLAAAKNRSKVPKEPVGYIRGQRVSKPAKGKAAATTAIAAAATSELASASASLQPAVQLADVSAVATGAVPFGATLADVVNQPSILANPARLAQKASRATRSRCRAARQTSSSTTYGADMLGQQQQQLGADISHAEQQPCIAAPMNTAAAAIAAARVVLDPVFINCSSGANRQRKRNSSKTGNRASSEGTSKSSSVTTKGPSRAAEQQLWDAGYQLVAGVDEAGRGPLAGPVVAAAAILPRNVEFPGLNDSKQLAEQARVELFGLLTTHPDVTYAVSVVDPDVIDEVNILQATMLAMQQAVQKLTTAPQHLLIDGNRKPDGLGSLPAQLLVKGDATSTCIAAASVIAKVTRDQLMVYFDQQYPQYGFAKHKGYGVAAHRAAISRFGPCPVHRRSFEPVKTMTGWQGYGQAAAAAALVQNTALDAATGVGGNYGAAPA